MNIETYWFNSTPQQRLYVLIDAGFIVKPGQPSRIAAKACARTWETLSQDIKNVLTRRAREGLISA